LLIPEPLEVLIEELCKLPSIGRKTAQRLAMHIIKSEKESILSLINSLNKVTTDLKLCSECYNISTGDLCEICLSSKRDRSILCIVEEVSDIFAIERTNEYNGLYHVLGGVLSPLSGVDAESLKINELVSRVKNGEIQEIILALNPDTEGDTTSLYLAKLLKDYSINISRIARGLPIGGNLEFADEATIGRAVLSRIKL